MKRSGSRGSDDDDSHRREKRSRNDRDRRDRTEMRLVVRSSNAGAVIGKGGANIKRLRQDLKASVILPDSNGPERLMIIGGDNSTVCDVLKDVIPTLDERAKHEDDESEIRFLIHQSQAGAVIGRGGSKVKELREDTGAHVKVYTQCCPMSTERIVQVTGKAKVIVKCVDAILDILAGAPPKGPNQPYDPHNSDEEYAADYGGYLGDRMQRGGRGGGGGRMGGFRGRDSRDDRDSGRRSSYGGRDDRDRDSGRDRGGRGDSGFGSGFGGGRFGGFGSGMSDMFRNNAKTSTQVSIPKDLAGLIIGKGGQRIKEIREKSGAGISIEDPSTESDDRIITITGTAEAIQSAQYLLQMSVKQRAGTY